MGVDCWKKELGCSLLYERSQKQNKQLAFWEARVCSLRWVVLGCSTLVPLLSNKTFQGDVILKPLLSPHSGVHWRPVWPGWLGCLEEVHWQCWHPGGWWWPDCDQPKAHCQGCGRESLQLPPSQGQPDWLCDRVPASVSSSLLATLGTGVV